MSVSDVKAGIELSGYTSVIGTFLRCRTCKRMSGVQGKPEVTRTNVIADLLTALHAV
jgi:hypothetical protein